MFKTGMGRLLGPALFLGVSLTLAACGGETPTATAVPAPTATTAPAAPTATTAPAAPAATAMAAPTNTAIAAATATTAMAAPTDTTAAAPTATTGSSSGGTSSGNSPVEQAIASMRTLKSFHLDVTTSAAGQNVTQGADVDVANNKLRMTSTTAGTTTTIVVIGNDSWMSVDGGKTYIPNPAGAQTAQALGAFIHMWDNTGTTAATATVPDAIKEGSPATEQIDGVDTKHYIVDSKDAAGVGGVETAGASGTVEFWISTDATPRIIQMKTTSSAAGQDSTVTIKWSKFDEDFGITAPK